jgi:hypothetical protein
MAAGCGCHGPTNTRCDDASDQESDSRDLGQVLSPEAVIPGSALIVGRNRIAEFKRDRRADDGRSRRPVRPGGRLLDAGQPEDAVLEYQETTRRRIVGSVGLWRRQVAWRRQRRPRRRASTALNGRAPAEEEVEAADQAQPVRRVPRAFLGTSVHANVAGCC